jgi:hypothetical protein
MSFQPYDRNPSGIVFFGTGAGDQLFESNSNFTIDGTTLVATNLAVSDGGTIGSASDADAITIASNGDVTFSQDISIAGDLTVNGTTTTVNSTTVTIDDPIFTLGGDTAPASDDNKDRGIEFNWHNGSTAKVGFFGFDDSTGKFTFIPDATNTSEVFSGTAGTIVADLEGDVTGNADTASAWATSRTITLGDELSGNVSIDGSADVTLNASLTAAAITGLTDLGGAPDATNDFIMIYDASATALKKVNRSNFVSGLGAMSNFTISDGTTTQQVDDGETVTFADGTGAEFVVSATNTITVNSVDSEINHDALLNFVANEHIDHTSVVLSAGNGLTGGGDISSSRQFNVGAGDGITVNTDDIAVKVDDSTLEINGSTEVAIKDGGVTFAKLAGAGYLTSAEAFSDSDSQLMTAAAIDDRILSYGYSTTAGTVTSVGGTGSVNGITLTGTVTSAGNLTLGGTLGNITVSQLAGSAVITSAESFSDDDTTLMTSAAIDDRILSYGYSTTTGTVTSITAGTGLSGGTITSTGTIAIANGGVDTLQLAADAVDGTKIADDSIDSEHYVDGSIDTAHVSAGAITEAKRTRSVSSPTTSVTLSNDINLCSGGVSGITVTLPAVASGKVITIKKKDSAAGVVTIQRGGSATIDGATTKALYHQYESMTLASDGTDWYII